MTTADLQRNYNKWFLQMLEVHWRDTQLLVSEQDGEGAPCIEASIPHDDPRRFISLSTFGTEITVRVGLHHSHFDTAEEDDHEEEFRRAIQWIRDFRDDRIWVCVEYNGDRIISTFSTYDFDDVVVTGGEYVDALTYTSEQRVVDKRVP